MLEKSILLTYIKDGKTGFDWFDNVENLEVSIIEQGIREKEICDIIKINSCEEIKLSCEAKACMSK